MESSAHQILRDPILLCATVAFSVGLGLLLSSYGMALILVFKHLWRDK